MVAFIPEGLPASVTISLSVVANALAKNKVLCKSLMTVETLGSCTMVLSDKTGSEFRVLPEHATNANLTSFHRVCDRSFDPSQYFCRM